MVDKAVQEITLPLRHEDIIRQQAARQGPRPGADRRASSTPSRASATRRRRRARRASCRSCRRPPTTSPRKSGGTRFQQGDLATPQINIAYGSFYLRYLLDRYDGNRILALAAYNAGEGKIDEWRAAAAAARASASGSPTTSRTPRRATTSAACCARRPATAATTRGSSGSEPAGEAPLAGRVALVTGVLAADRHRLRDRPAARRARRRPLPAVLHPARRRPAVGRRPGRHRGASSARCAPSSPAAASCTPSTTSPTRTRRRAASRAAAGGARARSTCWSPTTPSRCDQALERADRRRARSRAGGQRPRDAAARAGLRGAPTTTRAPAAASC